MTVRKVFQELEFRDSFMFAAAMEDEELCRMVLERILEIPIRSVKVQSESVLLFNSDYRGIRMDVFADDENGTVYDVEMQTANKGNLPKRSRFYQSQMDAGALKPGEDFNRLPQSFVIFICTFDPFGRGYFRYTFRPRCEEDGEILEDGTCRVFLNTAGSRTEQSAPELVRFLKYVENTSSAGNFPEDELLRQLESRIVSLKHSRRMEERYMLFSEILSDERREGEKIGENRLLKLMAQMKKDGLTEELFQVVEDPEFLQKMYEKYGLASPNGEDE